MPEPQWRRYPRVDREPPARAWLTIQANLGLAAATIDAYGRALEDYFAFGDRRAIVPERSTREHIAAYVNDLTLRPNRRVATGDGAQIGRGLANATLQQRLTAIRLYYDYLVEEGLRADNPGWPRPLHSRQGVRWAARAWAPAALPQAALDSRRR